MIQNKNVILTARDIVVEFDVRDKGCWKIMGALRKVLLTIVVKI